jgi:lipopolysaccharide/colanic/teichoic acid biosynthesis glycosyltransferase
VIRRCLDVALAGLGLMILSPLLALAALLVRWQSPGPVFFRSPRIGLNGQEFRIWKLRTMVLGADKGSPLTGRADPRITPVGRFLRTGKIDEFPQLINVLRGEMSLVGPRPETPVVVAQYSPEERQVLCVRPGITGPSQVRWRHEEDCYPPGVDTQSYYLAEILPRKLQTDLEYVRNRSLIKDLGYLWQTVGAIGKLRPGEGARKLGSEETRRLGSWATRKPGG